MCTIWEMAETIRAEERESAAKADASRASEGPLLEHDAPPPRKHGRIKARMQAAVALLFTYRNRAQN